jgi:AI-2E family transporter
VELARRTLIVVGTLAIVVIALGLAWHAYDVLLLAFGAGVLAVFLRTLGDWVAERTHLGPTWSLAIAVIGLIALLGAGAYVLAGRLADQTHELSSRLPIAIGDLEGRVGRLEGRVGRYPWGRGLLQTAGRWLSATDAATLVSAAERALVAGGRAVADIFVALFLGLLLAANPRLYIGGFVRLFPRGMRDAARATLADIGAALRHGCSRAHRRDRARDQSAARPRSDRRLRRRAPARRVRCSSRSWDCRACSLRHRSSRAFACWSSTCTFAESSSGTSTRVSVALAMHEDIECTRSDVRSGRSPRAISQVGATAPSRR